MTSIKLTNRPSLSTILIVFCGLIFILMSVTSQGFYHWDEHYQLLEFANYKSGLANPQGLAWEFREQIRPGLQPWVAYSLMSLCRSLGLADPFFIALILRLLSGAMSLFVIFLYSKLIVKESTLTKSGGSLFILLASLLWFSAFLFVRFSSENWSGLFFLAGIYALIHAVEFNSKKPFFYINIAGLLLGLAFQFRYQIAFAGIGIIAWLIYNKTLKIKGWVFLIAGAMLAIIIGLQCDYWLYGSYQLTPLKYFNTNLIQGKAASFGVSPWYAYFNLIFNGLGPVISIFLIVFFLAGLISYRKHYMAWIIVPFVLAHMAVGHKELRFMFPMLIPFLYLIVLGTVKTIRFIKINLPIKIILGIVCLFNLCILTLRFMAPADPHMPYYRFVYDLAHQSRPVVIFYTQSNMYGPSLLQMTFYKPPLLTQVEVVHPGQIDEYDTGSKNAFIFSDGQSALIKPERKSLRMGFTNDYWDLQQIKKTKKLNKIFSPWSLFKVD